MADGDGLFKSPFGGDDTDAFFGATALVLPPLLCVFPVWDWVVGNNLGGDGVREGVKGSTGVVGEDDFLKLGTAKDTATPNAKNAKARKTIAIVSDRLDGFSSFLLISNPPKSL